jgi:hypothetical protein
VYHVTGVGINVSAHPMGMDVRKSVKDNYALDNLRYSDYLVVVGLD